MTEVAPHAPISPPEKASRLEHYPVPLFGMVMGMAGLTLATRAAEHAHGWGGGASDVLYVVTFALFLLIAAGYAAKAIVHPRAVAAEWQHPVRLAANCQYETRLSANLSFGNNGLIAALPLQRILNISFCWGVSCLLDRDLTDEALWTVSCPACRVDGMPQPNRWSARTPGRKHRRPGR